jgi:serine/threonine protein kinase
MSLDNVQALPAGTQLGDYRLDVVIGHGSFGITYRAFDTQLAKLVAIKEYLPVEFAVRQGLREVVPRGTRYADDFAWGRDRFLDEARALARFRHAHIVPVLRYFEANGTAYTVMEFEDGRSLAELLSPEGRRLPPDDVRRLGDGLLSGLGAVHEQGFLHRDIKPSNIIIRRDGVPVLIDFGAARQAIGGRTRTLTGILTPQYAPIEQYALDGKQGAWSDIYSAAAVIHHALAGRPPPEAAARVGTDPYRPLVEREAGLMDATFLRAVDAGLAFSAKDRPQSVREWRAMFDISLPFAHDAPTQKMTPPPRLRGVNRADHELLPTLPAPSTRASRSGLWIVLVLLVCAGAAAWQFQPQLRQAWDSLVAPAKPVEPSAPQQASPPATPPQNQATAPTPTPTPDVSPAKPGGETRSRNLPLPPSQDSIAQKALVAAAERAAIDARAVFDKAKDASDAARTMAGEARIAAARAARPGLENSERLSYANGAGYIGQTAAGQRQGLGVADLEDGERQAGEWKEDKLSGLGTVRFGDGTRYEGQWREGQWAGLGVMEKPGASRAEGNFAAGKMEGPGVRRLTGDPSLVQSGEWHGDSLDGPGVESLPDGEKYEGQFRGSKRHGYGQMTKGDKTVSGRWDDGKLVESAP